MNPYVINCKSSSTFLLFLILLLTLPSFALAAVPSYLPYPSEDTLVYNPYGESDEAAQLLNVLQPFYRTVSGRSLKVEEMAGRGGATAWGTLVEKEGDGYTLAVTNLQSLILRALATRPVYRMDQISSTNIMAEAPLVLWVPENSPFPSLAELIRSAQAYPNQLIIAGSGSSSQTHLATLRLNFLAGIKTIYLPYIGSTTAMEAAKMGQAHAAWGLPLPEYGKKLGMRPLAVASKARLEGLPDTPTFEESKVGLFETAHIGLAAPGSIQPGTRQAVSAYFHNILENADLQAAIRGLGFTPLNLDLEGVNKLVESETERLKELLEQYDME